jgi:hypothetical protein
MNHFSSLGSYIRFAAARKFEVEDGASIKARTCMERLGGYMVTPLLGPAHFCMKNIRNPLMIAALTVSALFFATLLYYPSTLALIVAGIPAIKMGSYLTVQTTILGLCLRTLGRLNNEELMQKWDAGKLKPIAVGTTQFPI